MIALVLLLGCQPEPWEPLPGWENEEVPAPEVLLDGLDDPRGVVLVDDVIVVAEFGGGRVLWLDGEVVSVEGLDRPYMLATDGTSAVVTERGAGRVLLVEADGSYEVLADGLVNPGRVAVAAGTAWWVEQGAGAVWRAELPDGTPELVLDGLDAAGGIAAEAGWAYVVEGGAVRSVTAIEAATLEVETLASVEEIPKDIAVQGGEVYFTARSERWPGGGWVYLHDGSLEQLSYSPPGLSWLRLEGDDIYWASNQSITRVSRDGGTYEPVAILTAPGDFLLDGSNLVWTDRHTGELLTTPTD
jgi:hypothetical protein